MTVTELESLLSPALAALGYEWWGCVIQQRSWGTLLRIFIDKPGGIDVEDCARASHQINGVLEVSGAELSTSVPAEYTLEVSSPGLDRPLFTLAQYQRFIGYKVKLRLKMPLQGQRNFQGTVQAVEGHQITLQCDKIVVAILFENIERANVVPDFSQFGHED